MVRLQGRVARLAEDGQLGQRSVTEAVSAFSAVCEGWAALELRGRMLPGNAEALWRVTLGALFTGWRIA
jgi:hypothetical protein